MSKGFALAELLIIIEFLLVFLCIISVYSLKLIYFFIKKRNKKIQEETLNYLSTLLLKEQSFSLNEFKKKWRRLDLLIPIVDAFDKQISNKNWKIIRIFLIDYIILPLAKKSTYPHYWKSRFFAARAFSLLENKHNERFIIFLVQDKLPLIYLTALQAALKNKSEEAISLMITRMAKERKLTQSMYLKSFETAPIETRLFIEKYLIGAKDLYERATCYKILQKYPANKVSLDIKPDTMSENIELKLAALRFFAYTDKTAAVPLLILSLKDPDWESRVVAIQCLKELQAKESISQLALCLKDSRWWVRLNAGQALACFGNTGLDILKSQDPNTDHFAFEMAQHILKLG